MIFIYIENIVLFYKLGGVLDNSILILVWIWFLFYIDGKENLINLLFYFILYFWNFSLILFVDK